ncbi:unnamed protein product [Acanthoscelides obtectus]|uniref:Uncharacterized protein n=2 Tax=Acanthoscelides obtectus TaxID=200917 RepID=A0A9P0MC45_ACAOB|nr:unnamed protein product [Acanthoscelides obtectus]CAK1622504.1 hypothetical protein AOBTE_LOCUS1523 [Acanthoscelides obtectus]
MTASLFLWYRDCGSLEDDDNAWRERSLRSDKASFSLGKIFDSPPIIRICRIVKMSQELKKTEILKSGSGADEIYISKWPYFDALKFLKPIVSTSHTKSSMNLTKTSFNGVEKSDKIEEFGTPEETKIENRPTTNNSGTQKT